MIQNWQVRKPSQVERASFLEIVMTTAPLHSFFGIFTSSSIVRTSSAFAGSSYSIRRFSEVHFLVWCSPGSDGRGEQSTDRHTTQTLLPKSIKGLDSLPTHLPRKIGSIHTRMESIKYPWSSSQTQTHKWWTRYEQFNYNLGTDYTDCPEWHTKDSTENPAILPILWIRWRRKYSRNS